MKITWKVVESNLHTLKMIVLFFINTNLIGGTPNGTQRVSHNQNTYIYFNTQRVIIYYKNYQKLIINDINCILFDTFLLLQMGAAVLPCTKYALKPYC